MGLMLTLSLSFSVLRIFLLFFFAFKLISNFNYFKLVYANLPSLFSMCIADSHAKRST
jgi:hypothetical protein